MAKEPIFMPNEIFADLKENIESSQQLPFAYAYYYYVSYLYRYCKLITDNNEKITQGMIKEKLGYAPTYKKIDYIIKKDGILDSIGYTVTTTDYPIEWSLDENKKPIFLTTSEFERRYGYPINPNDRNYKIKYPLKGFIRNSEDSHITENTGTFFDVSKTHRIDYETFEAIISNEQLGVAGFYIYGLLKMKCSIFLIGYQASLGVLNKELGMSVMTIHKYLKVLEEYGFIRIDHAIFKFSNDEADKEANVYNIK